jgi:hypothetical protein
MAVDYLISAVVKAATVRILMLFNPAGAILQALEAIYRVLKWIFQNAARIFTLIETVVNGIADILAGSLGGFANAVEKALAMLIPPVIGFIADYLNFGDLPDTIAKKIKSFQDWIMGLIEKALVWMIEKGKALLAAVGLGAKDKDKKKDGDAPGTVGEEISFTGGGESHRLWIETNGTNAELMIASTKEALKGFLKGKRVREAIKKDKSGELGGLVEQALGIVAEADVDADNVLKELRKIKEGQEGECETAQVTKKNDEVKKEEQELAEVLAKIFELVGGGLKIVEVIGAEVDPLQEEPEGYKFWDPGLPKPFKELRRMPGYGGKSKEYPRVHVDIGGLIVASPGPHRYDLDLVRRYEEALEVAEGKRPLLGSPDTPVSNLKSRWERDNAANDPPARGHRQAMEAIIEAVNGPGTLIGVEVALTTGGVRADYIVQIGVVQRFVEVKAWKTINLEGRSSATTKFMDQVRGYVTEAQSRGKQQGGGMLVYEVHLQFRTEHEDIDRVRELVDNEVYNASRRKPPVIVTYEGLD